MPKWMLWFGFIFFLLKTSFGGFKIQLNLQDFPTHGGVHSHMASVEVYLLTPWLSTVRTHTLMLLRFTWDEPCVHASGCCSPVFAAFAAAGVVFATLAGVTSWSSGKSRSTGDPSGDGADSSDLGDRESTCCCCCSCCCCILASLWADKEGFQI